MDGVIEVAQGLRAHTRTPNGYASDGMTTWLPLSRNDGVSRAFDPHAVGKLNVISGKGENRQVVTVDLAKLSRHRVESAVHDAATPLAAFHQLATAEEPMSDSVSPSLPVNAAVQPWSPAAAPLVPAADWSPASAPAAPPPAAPAPPTADMMALLASLQQQVAALSSPPQPPPQVMPPPQVGYQPPPQPSFGPPPSPTSHPAVSPAQSSPNWWISAPPRTPQFRVTFHFGEGRGEMEAFYHDITDSGEAIVLSFDQRFTHGYAFKPPRLGYNDNMLITVHHWNRTFRVCPIGLVHTCCFVDHFVLPKEGEETAQAGAPVAFQ